MYDTSFKFREGARVRLKVGVDPYIYGDFARAGNEGIIAERDTDRFGLPEVYVRWDKNHWAYNGVQDCWTFEEHFELVEDYMSKENKLAAMFQEMAKIMGEEEPKEEKPKPQLSQKFRGATEGFKRATKPEPDPDEEYEGAVIAATEKLNESEAFVIVGVRRIPHPGAPDGILDPYALGCSKTDEGDVLVTAHMGSVAARAHQELALQTIAGIVADKSS